MIYLWDKQKYNEITSTIDQTEEGENKHTSSVDGIVINITATREATEVRTCDDNAIKVLHLKLLFYNASIITLLA